MHLYAFVKSTHVLVDLSLIWGFHEISLHYLLDFVLVPRHENCHLALFQGFQASCDWSLDGESALRNDLLIKCHHLESKHPTILNKECYDCKLSVGCDLSLDIHLHLIVVCGWVVNPNFVSGQTSQKTIVSFENLFHMFGHRQPCRKKSAIP